MVTLISLPSLAALTSFRQLKVKSKLGLAVCAFFLSYGYFSCRFFRYFCNLAYIYCHLRAGAAWYLKVKCELRSAVCAFFLSYGYLSFFYRAYFGDVTNVNSHLRAGPLTAYWYCKIKIKRRVTIICSALFSDLSYNYFGLRAGFYSLYSSNLYTHLRARTRYTVKPVKAVKAIKACRALYSFYTLYSYWPLYSYWSLYALYTLYSYWALKAYRPYWYREIKIEYWITGLAARISYNY